MAYTDKDKKRKRIMRKFRLREVSLVDTPAQSPAQIVLMKRDDDDVAKARAMTDTTAGHSHLIVTRDELHGMTTYERGGEGQVSHAHPWLKDDAGNIIVGHALGHTHAVNVLVTKENTTGGVPAPLDGTAAGDSNTAESGTGETKMADTTKAAEDQAAKIETLQKSNQRLQTILGLTPDQRAHFDTLKGDDADAFLAKSDSARAAILKGLADADAVVYQADDGTEFRKSDDARLVELAKRADNDRRELAKERELAKRADLEKRASDVLKNLPADAAVKADLLGAIEGIQDETRRTAAMEALKAHDAGLGQAFTRVGTREGADVTKSAAAQLDELAKNYADKHDVTVARAYDAVVATPEGARLYNVHRTGSR